MVKRNKFLSRGPGSQAELKGMFRKSLVWQWLQQVEAGTDETGFVLKLMRKRIDMPMKLPHKTYLQNYLVQQCKVDLPVAVRVTDRIWDLYATYRDMMKSEHGETVWPSVEQPGDKEIRRQRADSKWLSR